MVVLVVVVVVAGLMIIIAVAVIITLMVLANIAEGCPLLALGLLQDSRDVKARGRRPSLRRRVKPGRPPSATAHSIIDLQCLIVYCKSCKMSYSLL
jgi:hypothetical protein